eukprot:scaffold231979_cov15-Tisochrysis_lutea.AAC.1
MGVICSKTFCRNVGCAKFVAYSPKALHTASMPFNTLLNGKALTQARVSNKNTESGIMCLMLGLVARIRKEFKKLAI